MDTVNSKKVLDSVNDFCEVYQLVLLSVDTILKGNRVEITVANPENKDKKNGKLIPISVVIGYGKQTIEIEKYIYNVIRMECDGSESIDNISLYNFNSIKDARAWIKVDAMKLAASYGETIVDNPLFSKDNDGMYFYYTYGDNFEADGVAWQIRKLPLQSNGDWTDPEQPVRYRVNKGE